MYDRSSKQPVQSDSLRPQHPPPANQIVPPAFLLVNDHPCHYSNHCATPPPSPQPCYHQLWLWPLHWSPGLYPGPQPKPLKLSPNQSHYRFIAPKLSSLTLYFSQQSQPTNSGAHIYYLFNGESEVDHSHRGIEPLVNSHTSLQQSPS